ncbi:MAG TPA: hypothetical protein P5532_07280 [Planctomycetota bacterium]|nr:hypothetical protein [Planctomycetota bacterium]
MQVIGQDSDGKLSTVAVEPRGLAAAAALDSGVFRALNVEEAVPEAWEERAKLAWEYYTEEPIVKNAVNAWRTFAIGDEVGFNCEDEEVEAEVYEFAERVGLDAFVRDMVLQLLVKGDCVGYKAYTDKGDDIAAVQCINPVSVKLKLVQGELTEAKQFPEEGAIGEGISLPLEQLVHLKWDAPSFSPRGNSMVLPAFHAIALLRDYRKSESAIAKRWTTPLRFVQVGGQFGSKLVMPDQGMLDQMRNSLNKSDIKAGLVVPFYCDVKTYGTEGEVLKTEDKVKEIKEDIIVALGLARSIVTGDGPNFATASVSMQKMIIMLGEIKGAARRILRWVLDDWQEIKGYGEKTIEVLFNDLDLSDDADYRKLLVELYDRRLISRKSLQVRMALDPEVEATQTETERKEIDLTDEKVVKPIVDLVMAGVITPEYAREVLGIPQEKNKPAPDSIAARLGARGDVPDGICDECEYFDAEENWCAIRETETRFDNNACRYFEARETTVVTPAADATARPGAAEECAPCR